MSHLIGIYTVCPVFRSLKFKAFNVPSVAQTCSIVLQQDFALLSLKSQYNVHVAWTKCFLLIFANEKFVFLCALTPLQSERPKLYTILAFLSAFGLSNKAPAAQVFCLSAL